MGIADRKSTVALAVSVVLAVPACDVGGAEEPAPSRASRSPAAASEAEASPWTLAAPMSQRRSYVAAAKLDGRVYVAGGMVGETGRHLATFERFDPRSNAWTTLPRVPEPVRAAAGAAVGSKFYVIGGSTPSGVGGQVYAYDAERGRWRRAAPLPEPRFNHSAVALAGKIYVLGGFEEGEERDDVFVYDPGTDRWTTAAPLPRRIHAFGAVAFRGEIWVIGGRRGETVLREVWIYDPDGDRWRPGPALPKPMELPGATRAGREIHAVWHGTYQAYDAQTGRWRREAGPSVERHALSLFAVGGALYAVGGCTTALRDTQVVERRSIA
jgi:outer membrane protein assembly factor BamB